MQTIQEGNARIEIEAEEKISKKMPVFYNPVMELNRSISILLLNAINKDNLQIALPLAGSGIRGIRFLLELKKGKIKNLSLNDYKEDFKHTLIENLKLNQVKKENKVIITRKDANLFLLNSTGFDYIDIDPFGTPNPFLDAAAKRISRNGILAVTATDTSALSGTYIKACKRKYWATPLRNELMHEIGLRILIRKIQLIAAQYGKALIPIFSHSSDHYMRVYLKCEKGKSKVNEILKQHNYFKEVGPMWLGQLWDNELVNSMFKNNKKNKLLKIINEESKIQTVGFHDIHAICKRNKLNIPKTELLLKKIKHKTAKTHFSETGIRSNISEKELIKIIKKS